MSASEEMTDYLRVARVDHWLKNIFIVFGHVVALALPLQLNLDAPLMGRAVLSLIPACLLASANYILNEILDAPYDRLHPTKKDRPVAGGRVSLTVLWCLFAGLIVVSFTLAHLWFGNRGYLVSLFLLFLSGVLYNLPPFRLKDRAFLDVIAESFNNPVRLWLGWYALVPDPVPPPLSITLAWWCFGGLLMTGKRYAEYRFIDDPGVSGQYRRSFKVYSERSLIIAMITYANLFCFCSGWAVCRYPQLNNLALVFPVIVLAIIAFFRQALTVDGAEVEPEKLLKRPLLLLCTFATTAASGVLLYLGKTGLFRIGEWLPMSVFPEY